MGCVRKIRTTVLERSSEGLPDGKVSPSLAENQMH